jgi:hypothetical protein
LILVLMRRMTLRIDVQELEASPCRSRRSRARPAAKKTSWNWDPPSAFTGSAGGGAGPAVCGSTPLTCASALALRPDDRIDLGT